MEGIQYVHKFMHILVKNIINVLLDETENLHAIYKKGEKISKNVNV